MSLRRVRDHARQRRAGAPSALACARWNGRHDPRLIRSHDAGHGVTPQELRYRSSDGLRLLDLQEMADPVDRAFLDVRQRGAKEVGDLHARSRPLAASTSMARTRRWLGSASTSPSSASISTERSAPAPPTFRTLAPAPRGGLDGHPPERRLRSRFGAGSGYERFGGAGRGGLSARSAEVIWRTTSDPLWICAWTSASFCRRRSCWRSCVLFIA